ncbi:MAG: hypothetical protein BGO10_07485 [Chlamydia sp. 32-24]|nr:MAG: hypothetical protein BGO10_07485 [Chlamydia sp. 32-24]
MHKIQSWPTEVYFLETKNSGELALIHQIKLMAKKNILTIAEGCWDFFYSPSHFDRTNGKWSNKAQEDQKKFFIKLKNSKSQREDWYKVTSYIAEFWCTLSNIGFFYVGLKQRSLEILFAGLASTLSHAVPKQWLATVDKIGVAVVLARFIKDSKTKFSHPFVLMPLVIAGVINLSDTYLARVKGKTWPHVVWHLSAAFLANSGFNYLKK